MCVCESVCVLAQQKTLLSLLRQQLHDSFGEESLEWKHFLSPSTSRKRICLSAYTCELVWEILWSPLHPHPSPSFFFLIGRGSYIFYPLLNPPMVFFNFGWCLWLLMLICLSFDLLLSYVAGIFAGLLDCCYSVIFLP